MAYLTKDRSGLTQLWNNKPEYNEKKWCFQAWLPGKEGYHNEVAIDVTSNEYFYHLFDGLKLPSMIEITIYFNRIL